ncbi:phosphatidyl-myo-inositol alpha-mannosyltransferase [soil metagenome]
MAEKLQIAHVFDSNFDNPNGVSSYISTLAEGCREQGHDVKIIVGNSESSDPDVISVSKTVPVPANGNTVPLPLPISYRKARGILRDIKPDIIHIGVPYTPLVGNQFMSEAAPETGVVGTFHVLPYSKRAAFLMNKVGVTTSRTRKRLDHVLAASPEVQDYAQSGFGLQSTLMPCPVDIRRFKAGQRMDEYNDGKFNIFFLGRLDERKGPTHLLGALSLFDRDELSNLRVAIGGDGPDMQKLRDQANANGLNDVVEFAGRIPESDKPDFLASADITALPSTSGESFGISVVEAMASGAAVIAGDNAGYRSILSSRTPELLINPTHSGNFANVLSKLIKSDELRHDVQLRQQEGLHEYDTSTVTGRILDVYADVLASRRNG